VGAQGSLFGVVGGHQERPAGVLQTQPLPFQAVDPIPHHRQQQVDDGVVQEVDVIHIEHAPVGGSQEPWLEDRFPLPDGGLHIDGSQQPIFGDAQGNLDKGGRYHLGGRHLSGWVASLGPVGPGIRLRWIVVAIGSRNHLDGR
jgi:hypothetical protein